jgi:hypothetical protein
MDPRQETLEELFRKVEGRFFDTAIDEDIKDWANEQLAIAQSDIDLVVRGREGYLDFLVTFIGREHALQRRQCRARAVRHTAGSPTVYLPGPL